MLGIDILLSARELMAKHGRNASEVATQAAVDFERRGNEVLADRWRRIAATVKELQAKE